MFSNPPRVVTLVSERRSYGRSRCDKSKNEQPIQWEALEVALQSAFQSALDQQLQEMSEALGSLVSGFHNRIDRFEERINKAQPNYQFSPQYYRSPSPISNPPKLSPIEPIITTPVAGDAISDLPKKLTPIPKASSSIRTLPDDEIDYPTVLNPESTLLKLKPEADEPQAQSTVKKVMVTSPLENISNKVRVPIVSKKKEEGYVCRLVEKLGDFMGRDVKGLILEGCISLEAWNVLKSSIVNGVVEHVFASNLYVLMFPSEGMTLHLSHVCLGELKKDKGNESVCLFVNVDGKKLVLATLFTAKLPQQQFDLMFERDFELSHNWTNGSVYVYGYNTNSPFHREELHRDEFDVSESEEEETSNFAEIANRNPEEIYKDLKGVRKSKVQSRRDWDTMNEVLICFCQSGWASNQALAVYIGASFFPFAARKFSSFLLKKCDNALAKYLASVGPGIDDDKFLFPIFVEFCIEEFPDEIKRFRGMVESADMTKPDTWFPFTRAMKRKIVYHCGPTNSGKTYNALQRFMEANKGVYCSPCRLLAMEVFDRVNASGVYCSLRTGQERKESPFSNHTACTVEMVSTEELYEVAVIDEIQMMADPCQGYAWTRALLGLKADETHLCGDPSVLNVVRKICSDTGDELVEQHYERFKPLVVEAKTLLGDLKNVRSGDCIVAFSRREIFEVKLAIEKYTNHRCCVIYGALPPETRRQQTSLFNDQDNEVNVLVASDVVGRGVGGIEAEATMLDQPMSMVLTGVVGFKLSGELHNGVTAADLVLTVTQMLRKHGVVGKFIESDGKSKDQDFVYATRLLKEGSIVTPRPIVTPMAVYGSDGSCMMSEEKGIPQGEREEKANGVDHKVGGEMYFDTRDSFSTVDDFRG